MAADSFSLNPLWLEILEGLSFCFQDPQHFFSIIHAWCGQLFCCPVSCRMSHGQPWEPSWDCDPLSWQSCIIRCCLLCSDLIISWNELLTTSYFLLLKKDLVVYTHTYKHSSLFWVVCFTHGLISHCAQDFVVLKLAKHSGSFEKIALWMQTNQSQVRFSKKDLVTVKVKTGF